MARLCLYGGAFLYLAAQTIERYPIRMPARFAGTS